ncbi:kinase D-interacting substrate of 220 kDa B isoform X4 [Aricia agestis]|uniref:kinase D-interacting substrate of 220 kDa B isoform X4 n=1 Tax=Aricia agestis TaxID=91739 RepID=UPI001C20BC37|nr:kinase D-interacting substrate of 220 kDa B isoform X4 [Aricia agestis]
MDRGHSNLIREGSKSTRMLTDSISSDEPETERLLNSNQPSVVKVSSGRRQSLTAPPSPTDSRKKRDHRTHYRNHLHHFIHWRDIWGGEPHKANEAARIAGVHPRRGPRVAVLLGHRRQPRGVRPIGRAGEVGRLRRDAAGRGCAADPGEEQQLLGADAGATVAAGQAAAAVASATEDRGPRHPHGAAVGGAAPERAAVHSDGAAGGAAPSQPRVPLPRVRPTPALQHGRRLSTSLVSLHRSESMVSLACFKTLTQLINNDSNELQNYLSSNKNINVDDRDENGTTALMCASECGRANAVELLLGAGADANAADNDGWTPLAFAARGGHVAAVKELLDAGAVVDSRDCGGWTPLMWAAYKGHEDIVALLLEKGADVHAHGNYNINSLVWASGRRHSAVVLRLLAAGARPNSCDKYGTSALTWAARAGDVAACAALLRAGADPHATGMYCWTPLLQATHGNHVEIVQMLLEHKPNVNALDKDGCTALAIACKEGFYDIALALISSGAYINVQDHSKDTPLIYAVKGGYRNIVEALLKKHVDVDLPGKEKKTPVYTAVEKQHVGILKLLLASNPDLELCTTTGDTALLRAVRSRNAEMVQLLLEKRARVSAADSRGDTALHIAMRARSKQIVEILLRNPKNSQLLYKPNKMNETPYNIDMSYNKTILGQIFGARRLNTNEDNENLLGYELYSAALADMLAEPSLSVPITVGLYARWGSGKSFLLTKLKEEMKNFARQWNETGWAWSWAVAWGAWHAALAAAVATALAGARAYVALAVCFGLFATLYLAFYLLWYLGNRYEWWWSTGVVAALGRRFGSLLLVLQVVFCHPPGPNDPRALPATPIRFHFTEGMRSGGGQEGVAAAAQMLAGLAEALECQYGRVCTRLARAFRPTPISSTSSWKWRRSCCVPHIITFEVGFVCVLLGVCVLVMYLTDSEADPAKMEVRGGVAVGAGVAAGALVLGAACAAGRALAALALPPRTRLARAARADPHARTLALRPEVHALTQIVTCLDAFTGQQTRLVIVVDALDSCEQEKVLALLNAIHALCSDPKSPFILLLAIDPHIISKVAWMEAVEVNSRRAFSESNIGGWDYLRNMVQLPFYLQNSALRRVKVAQLAAARRLPHVNEDLSTSLQRSVSARRLSSTSELMSSQEPIKVTTHGGGGGSRRLRASESVASSMASGLHRAVPVPAGAADLSRVLLTDDYFSDVNPRSMRRLMNVLYVTGRLLKAFQIEFNWYQLASWVNLTEQWPFRTSWIIYHHETYEEHIDDSTSLKHIYEKVKPLIGALRESSTLSELDRDERKLEVFLSFHRSTLTAADLKIFLPFTINLDPYIKKVIKEDQAQAGVDEEIGGSGAAGVWNTAQQTLRPPHKSSKKQVKLPPTTVPNGPTTAIVAAPQWAGTEDAPPTVYPSAQAQNPIAVLKTAFPGLADVSSLRLSTLSVERVCGVARAALGAGGAPAADALQRARVCGLALAVCSLEDLKPVLDLPFGDWELFKMLVLNLRELEAHLPLTAPTVAVIPDKAADESDTVKRPALEHQRSRPSNVEKQVTLEEQMICGALQTLSEEAMEEPPASPAPDAGPSPPPAPRAPAVSFSVESEDDDGHITFAARPRPRRAARAPRPASLRLDEPPARPAARAHSVEDTAAAPAPAASALRRTADALARVGSADGLARLKDRILSRGGSRERSPARSDDDESAPLVCRSPAGRDLAASPAGRDLAASPASDLTELESPRADPADLLPCDKSGEAGGGCTERGGRRASDPSLDMVEPYNMRLLGHALWRQDALDDPPWPWAEPDSAV